MARRRRRNKGFAKGPKCRVCQSHFADSGETICFWCKAQFQQADWAASNPAMIRADMQASGVPMRGRSATFSTTVRDMAGMHKSDRGLDFALRFKTRKEESK